MEIRFNPNITGGMRINREIRKQEKEDKNKKENQKHPSEDVKVEISSANATSTQDFDIKTLQEADALLARIKEAMNTDSEKAARSHNFNRERIYSLLVDIEV